MDIYDSIPIFKLKIEKKRKRNKNINMNKEKLKHKWKEINGFHISVYKINKQNSHILFFYN